MKRAIIHDPAFLARPAEEATPRDVSIGQDLLDTLQAHQQECVGLAANMIGESKRVIAFSEEGRLRVMYNPILVRRSRPFETEEGCLSLSGRRKTTRYVSVRVQYQDAQWNTHVETFLGFTAQIIQHECDHCEGILI